MKKLIACICSILILIQMSPPIITYSKEQSSINLNGTINKPVVITSGEVYVSDDIVILSGGSLTISGGYLEIEPGASITGDINLNKLGECCNKGTIKGNIKIDADTLPQRQRDDGSFYTPDNFLNDSTARIGKVIVNNGNILNSGMIDSASMNAGNFKVLAGYMSSAVVSGGELDVGNGGRVEAAEVKGQGRLYVGGSVKTETGLNPPGSVRKIIINGNTVKEDNAFIEGVVGSVILNSGQIYCNNTIETLVVNGGKAFVESGKNSFRNATWNCSMGSISINAGECNIDSCFVDTLYMSAGTACMNNASIKNSIITGTARLNEDVPGSLYSLIVNGQYISKGIGQSNVQINQKGSVTKDVLVLGDSKFMSYGDEKQVILDCNPPVVYNINDEELTDQSFMLYGNVQKLVQYNGHSFINGRADEFYYLGGTTFIQENGNVKTAYKEDSLIINNDQRVEKTVPYHAAELKKECTISGASAYTYGGLSGASNAQAAVSIPNSAFYVDKADYKDIWFKTQCEENSVVTCTFQAPSSMGCLLIEGPEGIHFSCASTGDTNSLTFRAPQTGTYYFRIVGGKTRYGMKVGIQKPVKVLYGIRKQFTVANGKNPVYANEDTNSYSIELKNITKNKVIKDYTLHQDRLYISPLAAIVGDKLQMTIKPLEKDTAPCSQVATVGVGMTVGFKFQPVQLGGLSVSLGNPGKRQETNIFIFDNNGKLVRNISDESKGQADTAFVRKRMPAGSYHLVFIKGSSSLWQLERISDYKALGLSEGKDFAKKDVNIKDGFITSIKSINVPDLPQNIKRALDTSSTNYTCSNEVASPGSLVTMRLAYKFTGKFAGKSGKSQAVIQLPDGSGFVKDSLTLDGHISAAGTKGSNITLALNKPQGVILFKIKPDGKCPIIYSSASISFTTGNIKMTELAGNIRLDVPQISIKGQSATATGKVNLSGAGIPNGLISVYDGNKKIGQVICNKGGSWELGVTLVSAADGAAHSITARLYAGTKNEVSSSPLSIVSNSNLIDITEFAIYYNAHTQQKIVLTKENMELARPKLSLNPGTPLKFTVKADNSDKIANMNIVSTRNGERKAMQASYDPAAGLWTANGYFDPENQNYIPGRLSIECIPKDNSTVLNLSTDIDTNGLSTGDIPSSLYNADAKVLENSFKDGNGRLTVQYTLQNDTHDVIKTTFEKSTGPAQKSPEELVKEGFDKVPLNDGSIGFIKTEKDISNGSLKTTVLHLYKQDKVHSSDSSAGYVKNGKDTVNGTLKTTVIPLNKQDKVFASLSGTGSSRNYRMLSYPDVSQQNVAVSDIIISSGYICDSYMSEVENKSIKEMLDKLEDADKFGIADKLWGVTDTAKELSDTWSQFGKYGTAVDKAISQVKNDPTMTEQQKTDYENQIYDKLDRLSAMAVARTNVSGGLEVLDLLGFNSDKLAQKFRLDEIASKIFGDDIDFFLDALKGGFDDKENEVMKELDELLKERGIDSPRFSEDIDTDYHSDPPGCCLPKSSDGLDNPQISGFPDNLEFPYNLDFPDSLDYPYNQDMFPLKSIIIMEGKQ